MSTLAGASDASTAANPQPGNPSDSPASADEQRQQMRITKLEQEIFSVAKQLQETKKQLEQALGDNAMLKEQVATFETEKLERAKLFQSVEHSRDELLVERTQLANAKVLLTSQKDSLEAESAKLLNEKRHLGEELMAARTEAATTKKELCEAQVKIDGLSGERRLLEYDKDRWEREKGILLQGKQWCMREIADRETKLNELRVQLVQSEMLLQRERAQVTAEREETHSRIEDLQKAFEKRDTEANELREKVQQLVEERSTAMNEIEAEMRANERLTNVYKQSLESANDEIRALKESEELLHSQFADMESEKSQLQAAVERLTAEKKSDVEEREERIGKLEDELRKANDLLQSGAVGQRLLSHNGEEELAALSPAAAAAANLLKSGYSLTSIYAEHCRVVGELERKTQECESIERSVRELITELDEKAPLFRRQSELYEKSQEEIETLRLQNELLNDDRQKLIEARDAATRELNFTNRELERYQRDHQTLKMQIRRLLFVAARGESPNASTAVNTDSDEEYVLFDNIKDLHQRNVELISCIKQMKTEQEQHLVNQRSAESEQTIASLNATKQELTRVRENLSKQESLLNELTSQRDHYKRLYEEAKSSLAAVAATESVDEEEGVQLAHRLAKGRKSLEAAESELERAKQREQFLQDKLEYFVDDKQRLEKALNERIDQLIEQVSQMRTTNGKLESDLEFQKKNQRLYATQLEEAEAETRRHTEQLQKTRSQHEALQVRYDQLSNQIIEQQGEVSRLRVANHSLDEQLTLSRAAEQRAANELAMLHDTRYNAERVALALQEVEVLLKRVDAQKDASLHSQLESTRLERDEMKALAENLTRQHSQLTNSLKLQLNELTGERDKVQLEAKSLREELTLTSTKLGKMQEEFERVTAASMEISSGDTNLESCKKEVQQLKNKLTYQERQLAEWKGKAEELTSTVERKEKELEEIRALSSRLESAMREQSDSSSVERVRLEARAEQLQLDLTSMNTTCETLRSQVAALELKVVQRERQVEKAETLVQEARTEGERNAEAYRIELASKQEMIDQLQSAVESSQEENGKVNSRLSALQEESSTLSRSLAEQSERYAVLEKELAALKTTSQTELKVLRDCLELRETERLRNLDEITSLQQRDKEAAERTQQLYDEIQKLVEQISLMEQLNTAGSGGAAALDTSLTSTSSGAGEGSLPSMERLSTIIGYMREEKRKETELRMNAELEMQRQRVKSQLAEEKMAKMEGELREARQVAETNQQAALEKERLVGQLELFKQVQQRYTELKRSTEEITKRYQATDAKAKELEAAQLVASKEKSENDRRLDALQKEVETKKREVLVLRQRCEQATALAAKYAPEKYATMTSELERAKQANAAQAKEIEAMKTQLSAAESQLSGTSGSSALVAKLKTDLENKQRLLVQTRLAGQSYRDRFNESTKAMGELQAEVEKLRQQVKEAASQPAQQAKAGRSIIAAAAEAAASVGGGGGAVGSPTPAGRQQRSAADVAEIEALKSKVAEAERQHSDLEARLKQVEAEKDEAVEKSYRLDTVTSLLTQKDRRIRSLEERIENVNREKEEERQRRQQLQEQQGASGMVTTNATAEPPPLPSTIAMATLPVQDPISSSTTETSSSSSLFQLPSFTFQAPVMVPTPPTMAMGPHDGSGMVGQVDSSTTTIIPPHSAHGNNAPTSSFSSCATTTRKRSQPQQPAPPQPPSIQQQQQLSEAQPTVATQPSMEPLLEEEEQGGADASGFDVVDSLAKRPKLSTATNEQQQQQQSGVGDVSASIPSLLPRSPMLPAAASMENIGVSPGGMLLMEEEEGQQPPAIGIADPTMPGTSTSSAAITTPFHHHFAPMESVVESGEEQEGLPSTTHPGDASTLYRVGEEEEGPSAMDEEGMGMGGMPFPPSYPTQEQAHIGHISGGVEGREEEMIEEADEGLGGGGVGGEAPDEGMDEEQIEEEEAGDEVGEVSNDDEEGGYDEEDEGEYEGDESSYLHHAGGEAGDSNDGEEGSYGEEEDYADEEEEERQGAGGRQAGADGDDDIIVLSDDEEAEEGGGSPDLKQQHHEQADDGTEEEALRNPAEDYSSAQTAPSKSAMKRSSSALVQNDTAMVSSSAKKRKFPLVPHHSTATSASQQKEFYRRTPYPLTSPPPCSAFEFKPPVMMQPDSHAFITPPPAIRPDVQTAMGDISEWLKTLEKKGVLDQVSKVSATETETGGPNKAKEPPKFKETPTLRPSSPTIPCLYWLGRMEHKPEPTPELEQFTTQALLTRYDSVVEAIHQPRTVCPQCGITFKELNGPAYQAHCDWHLQETIQARDKKYSRSSPWYMTDEWFTYSETELVNQPPPDGGEQASENKHTTNDARSEDTTMKDCCVCKERFEEYWDDDDDAWRLRNCMIEGGKAFHSSCKSDVHYVAETADDGDSKNGDVKNGDGFAKAIKLESPEDTISFVETSSPVNVNVADMADLLAFVENYRSKSPLPPPHWVRTC